MVTRPLTLAAALVLAGTAGASNLAAQNEYIQQMQGYMASYSAPVLSAGYTPASGFQTGSLAQGANTSINVNLIGGTQYVIIGVCDRDCTDVDLSIYTSNGVNLATDVALDDHPTLRITAPRTGPYRVRVSMATCRVAPCWFGFQVFALTGMAPTPVATTMGAPAPLGMIGLNQQINGNLTGADARYDGKPMQAWAFQCQPGMAFQMNVLSEWDNYAIIFDPNGNISARDDDTGEGLNARIAYTCGMAGTYRLAVTTFSASTTPGAYTLQVAGSAMAMAPTPTPMPMPMPMAAQPTPQPMPITPQPQAIPGGAQSMAQPIPMAPSSAPLAVSQPTPMAASVPAAGAVAQIQIGQTLNGRLESGDQQMSDGTWADVWQFQGTSGQSVTIELRSTEFDTYAQLLDAAGTRLAEDDDSAGNLDSRITFRLPSTGMFQVVVNNFSDSRRAGAYTISLR